MSLVKVTFSSVEDMTLFIQSNKISNYSMSAAGKYIITPNKAFDTAPGVVVGPVLLHEQNTYSGTAQHLYPHAGAE